MAVAPQTLKLTKAKLEKCLTDPDWRLRNLYAIRPKQGGLVKFRPKPVQEKVLREYWYVNYLLKSRQQGMSTLWVIFFLDRVLFSKAKIAGVIDMTDKQARKKLSMAKRAYDAMDDPIVHPDTWEIGAMIKRRVRMVKGQDAEFPEELVFSNGSAFWAGVGFRGDTLQYGLFTEFGKISASDAQKAKEIVEGAENGMHEGTIAVYETTHEGGRAGLAYERCMLARRGEQDRSKMSRLEQRFLFIGWQEDPDNRESEGQAEAWKRRLSASPMIQTVDGPFDAEKYFDNWEKQGVTLDWRQKAWYCAKKSTQGHGMLKEHPTGPDEPFEAPVEGAIYASIIVNMRERGCIRSVTYTPAAPVYSFWDLGAPENTMVWYLQHVDGEVRVLRCDYGKDFQTAGERVAWMKGLGYAYGGHFLPHDGAHRQKGGRTFKAELEAAGLTAIHALPKIGDVTVRINRLKGYLPEMVFDATLCEKGLIALEAYHWKEDKSVPGTFIDKPTDKWPSHASDAIGYYAEARMRNLIHVSMSAGLPLGSSDRFTQQVAEGKDQDVGLKTWGSQTSLPLWD